eukprot:2350823-Rhodomonas_salina.1
MTKQAPLCRMTIPDTTAVPGSSVLSFSTRHLRPHYKHLLPRYQTSHTTLSLSVPNISFCALARSRYLQDFHTTVPKKRKKKRLPATAVVWIWGSGKREALEVWRREVTIGGKGRVDTTLPPCEQYNAIFVSRGEEYRSICVSSREWFHNLSVSTRQRAEKESP